MPGVSAFSSPRNLGRKTIGTVRPAARQARSTSSTVVSWWVMTTKRSSSRCRCGSQAFSESAGVMFVPTKIA